jgi:hypothetical protein
MQRAMPKPSTRRRPHESTATEGPPRREQLATHNILFVCSMQRGRNTAHGEAQFAIRVRHERWSTPMREVTNKKFISCYLACMTRS